MNASRGTGGEVACVSGEVYCTRTHAGLVRWISVDAVLHDRGAPYADVHEIGAPCTHGALRALATDGACPVCPPAPDARTFTVQLTYAPDSSGARAWRMPSWYQGPPAHPATLSHSG